MQAAVEAAYRQEQRALEVQAVAARVDLMQRARLGQQTLVVAAAAMALYQHRVALEVPALLSCLFPRQTTRGQQLVRQQ
jgi:hypothetical protein